MNSRIYPSLACRYCHHYQFEGRRGGHCHKLGVPVKGEWTACSLMKPSLSNRSVSKPHGIKLKQYVSEIYSYETAAKLKSNATQSQIKAS